MSRPEEPITVEELATTRQIESIKSQARQLVDRLDLADLLGVTAESFPAPADGRLKAAVTKIRRSGRSQTKGLLDAYLAARGNAMKLGWDLPEIQVSQRDARSLLRQITAGADRALGYAARGTTSPIGQRS